MTDNGATREQLLEELGALRRRVVELEAAASQAAGNEALVERVVANLPVFVAYLDCELNYRFVNDEYERMFGVPSAELVGRNVVALLGKRDDEHSKKVRSRLDAALAGRAVRFEHALQQGDNLTWLERSCVPDLDADGKVVGIFCVGQDITEHKQAKDRLAGLNQLKKDLLHLGTFSEKLTLITDGVVSIFGADFARIWVARPGDVCDSGCFHAAASEGPHSCQQRDRCLHLVASSGRYTHTNGQAHRRVPFGAYKIGRVASSEEPGFLTNNVANDLRVHDRGWARELGLVSFAGYRLLSRERKPVGVLALFSQQALSPQEHSLLESVANTAAQVVQVAEAEAAVRAALDRFQTVMDGLDALVYVADFETYEVLFVNKYARDIWGDMTGEICWKSLQSEQTGPCEFCTNALLLDAKRRPAGIHRWEFQNTVTGRWFDCRDQAVRWLDGRLVRLEIATDITERKHAEEERRSLEQQVQQAQKLESLGILAGGIAHDFNNILAAVLGNADLALHDLPNHSPIRPQLLDIQQSGRRAAELTGQMLAYSGKGRFVIEDIDINSMVQDMSSLLQSSTSKKVELRYHLSTDLPAVTADATQLRQIVMNLVSNAAEAIGDEGGLVKLCTYCSEHDRDALEAASPNGDLVEGRYVTIEVTDTGCGMDDETKARVFDPFFTTKFTGRGLGLAAVQGIVRGHKGAIVVESAPGKGTMFRVLLPASERLAAPVTAPAEVDDDWRGSGTILVVDDEKMMRTVVSRMLKRVGFSVLTASDGIEAVDVFRARSEELACVLLDLKMPRMDGEEAYEEIRKITDRVPVILTSGYSEEESTKRFADKGLAGFIKKPYEAPVLESKLREVLGVARNSSAELPET